MNTSCRSGCVFLTCGYVENVICELRKNITGYHGPVFSTVMEICFNFVQGHAVVKREGRQKREEMEVPIWQGKEGIGRRAE